MRYRNKGSWDALTYDQVSRLVQYRWGQQVIKWRKWRGNEIVMDAGCGSGLLTKELAGFDTTVNQECENLICTHPGENATCVQEGAAAVAAVQQGIQTTTPVKLTCEQCFTKFLTTAQITILRSAVGAVLHTSVNNLEKLCAAFPTITTEAGLVDFLNQQQLS